MSRMNVNAQVGAALAYWVLTAPVHAFDDCDLGDGEKVFQKCAVCHSIKAGEPHGVGPNLNGVVGRGIGKVEGFKFSRGMRESDQTWTAAHLDGFLENPMGVYPRTQMAFSGLKKAQDRTDVLCFIGRAGEGDMR
jgi:cytochrome c